MRYLENKMDEIDWSQDPSDVHMFEVSWFSYTLGLAEMSNEILKRFSNKDDYIKIMTTHMSRHVGIAKGFGSKKKPTIEMKKYLKECLIKGIRVASKNLKKHNCTENQIELLELNIKKIEKHL